MTSLTPGTILSRSQALFSWALSEVYSPRWQKEMTSGMSEELQRKIEKKQISDFSEAEQEECIALLRKRREYFFTEYVDHAHSFRLIDIPIEIAELLPVLPSFSYKDYPVPLGHYVDWDFKLEWKNDPRNHALEAMKNPKTFVYPGYPVIAYSRYIKSDLLIEGYLRCISAILKHRKGEAAGPIRMIYCEVEPSKRVKAFYTE